MTGLDIALTEITLVLFTTLAPSGALAYALFGLPDALGASVPTWSAPLVPANLWLSALVGGPVLALACFAAVSWEPAVRRVGGWPALVLEGLSAAALIANLVCLALQGAAYPGMVNAVADAWELTGCYPAFVAGYAALAIAGLPTVDRARRTASRRRAFAGCALVLAGVFLTRFAFYMAHMAVGLAA